MFCWELAAYGTQSKRFSASCHGCKGLDKLLTGPRGSKAGRPDLYRRSAYSQVFKHVFDRLDASEAYNWCLDGLLRFPNQLQGNGFIPWPQQPARRVPQPDLSEPEFDAHCRDVICPRPAPGPAPFGPLAPQPT